MMLFPRALFVATIFPKIDKNSLFLLNFHLNFVKVSPTNCVFRQNARKFNAGFLNFFWKIGENNAFLQFSKGIFANLRKFSGVRGLRPRTPYEAGHNLEPPKFFSAYATDNC